MLAVGGRVDIEDDVDADRVENGHAFVVVEGRVQVVRADGVDSEVLGLLALMGCKTEHGLIIPASKQHRGRNEWRW